MDAVTLLFIEGLDLKDIQGLLDPEVHPPLNATGQAFNIS